MAAGLAKLATSAKNLPLLIGIPAAIIFVMWLLSGGNAHPDQGAFCQSWLPAFFGTWDFRWYAKNIFFIVLLWCLPQDLPYFPPIKAYPNCGRAMSAKAGMNPCLSTLVHAVYHSFLWPSLVEIVKHSRFRECKVNIDRVRGISLDACFHRSFHRYLLVAFEK